MPMPFGHGEVLDYNLYRRKGTKVTDPRGFVREYSYDKHGGLTKLVRAQTTPYLMFENTATDGLRYQKTDGLGYARPRIRIATTAR